MNTIQIEMVDIERLFEMNPFAKAQAENIARTRIMQTMQARIEELEKAPEFHPTKMSEDTLCRLCSLSVPVASSSSSPVPMLDG